MEQRIRQPAHPGAILKRHYLEPLNLSITRVANALNISRKTLSKIVNEDGDVTPEMALRLAKTFDTSPELWLNLQQNYNLWHTSHKSHAWQRVQVLMTKASSMPVAVQA